MNIDQPKAQRDMWLTPLFPDGVFLDQVLVVVVVESGLVTLHPVPGVSFKKRNQNFTTLREAAKSYFLYGNSL